MKTRSRLFAFALIGAILAGVAMTGCSSDDPKFVKRDTCHLTRSEDGEMRWYVDGKSMTVDQFKTQVMDYKWIMTSLRVILEDGTLPAEPEILDGDMPLVMYFDDDIIHQIIGPATLRLKYNYKYSIAGDEVDYLPNRFLPIEVDENGVLYAIRDCSDATKGLTPWPHSEYWTFRKMSDEEFQRESAIADEDMKRNGQWEYTVE